MRTKGAAVLVVDICRFKAINESLGRHIGSRLLGSVAERIRSALGSADIAARLGATSSASSRSVNRSRSRRPRLRAD
ncbi:MAG: diguanylate cyclase [Bradyrhizobium sp.]